MAERITREITREQAEEWDLSYDAPGELDRFETGSHRWYDDMTVVFTAPDDGLIWGADYMCPATEEQEGQETWHGETVTLTRYESYEKTVTAWRPVEATDGD